MLTRLYCDNYKCLVNFEIQTAPLQLLMGRNGAGKSTVFEVLELLRDFAVRGAWCEACFGGATRTRWQQLDPQKFEMEVAGNGGVYLYEVLIDEDGQPAHTLVRRESVTFDRQPIFLFEDGLVHLHNDFYQDKTQFPLTQRRSGLSIVESRRDNTKLSWFKEWLGRLLYVQIDPKNMGARAEKEDHNPLTNLANFAAWYRHLRLSEGTATEALRKSLQDVISGFESLDLRESGRNVRELQVTLRTNREGNGKLFPYAFDELSDGQRALVGLYTLLHCGLANQATLCIDEPDNFVALAEIQPWLLRLSDVSEDTGSQVLIASHHPELLNQLATQHGVVLDRTDGGPTRVKAFAPPSDTTLTPYELVARGWESA